MDAINYLLVLVAIINSFLGGAILIRSRKKTNVVYAIAIFSVVVWIITMIGFRTADQQQALVWSRLLYAASTLIPSTFLYFTTLFPRHRWTITVLLLVFVPNAVMMVATLFTSLIIQQVTVSGTVEPVINFGPLYPLFSLYISTFFTIGFVVLAVNYFRTTGNYRSQIRYIFLGYFIAANGAMVTNLIMPYYFNNFSLNWLGQCFSLIMIGFTTNAIIRYRLLNLKFVLTRSLVYIVLVGVIATAFVLSSSFTAVYFENRGVNQLAVWILFAIVIVLGIDPLRNVFANITDKFFYKEKIDYKAVVRDLTNSINEEIDLESLVDHITTELADRLKLSEVTVLLAAYEQEVFLPIHKYHHYPKTRKSTRPVDKNDRVFHNSSLIKYLRRTRSLVVTDELERYIYDIDNLRTQEQFEKVYKDLILLEAAAVVPVVRESRLTALLLIGQKVSGEVISDEDVNVFQVIAAQMSAALERSKLYEEVQAFNVKLQKEVDRATKNLQSANRKLVQANDDLKELDKAKSEFMSIASHQLRTPLAGIVGYLSMVLEGDYGSLRNEHTTILSDVFSATQRLVRLVNTLLNVTRIEAGRFSMFYSKHDIVKILTTEIFELQPTANKKGVELLLDIPEGMDSLEIDADDKLREVFLNLIDNAIKYTASGFVRITIRPERKNLVHVSVSDSGIGLDPEDAKKLFGKFVRGSKSARIQPDGSGLGLYIVKKIVEGHHGKIWAESEGVGTGSAFHVVVPKIQKESEYTTAPEMVITASSQ